MHVHVLHIVYNEYIITPCTCTRVKQLFCHYYPHKNCQISRSRYLSEWSVLSRCQERKSDESLRLTRTTKATNHAFLIGHAF